MSTKDEKGTKEQGRPGSGSTAFILVFIFLLLIMGAWWYFVLPSADYEGLRQVSGVIGQALAAVLGVMVVASIFAFSKVDECRKKMRKVKPKYIDLLAARKEGTIFDLKEEILLAIANSDSVEERAELLGKLYNVSVLCGVAQGNDREELKELKLVLVKNGYSEKTSLDDFESSVFAASVDEYVFFQFVEELVISSAYKRFERGRELITLLSAGFFSDDSIHDYLWTIRGGAETTGPVFKLTVVIASIAVIFSFLVLPAVFPSDFGGDAAVWSISRVLAGVEVTLGVFSFLYITRYIIRVASGKY